MPTKPTGQQGYYRVVMQGEGRAEGSFVREMLGTQKEEIELAVASKFVAAWSARGVTVEALPSRVENDLDFTLVTAGGEIKLELTELVFPPPKGERMYQPGGSFSSTLGESSDRVIATIEHKARRYARGTQPIHLLVYATHEMFEPVEGAIRLTQYRLANGYLPQHPFECIFYLEDLPTGPSIRSLFPVPPELLSGIDPTAEEPKEYVRFAPDGWS